MNVLGIDPSYTRTGIATHADTRSLEPPTRWPQPRRRAWILDQLAPAMHQADIIAIEGLYPVVQAGFLDRAYLLGRIIDAAYTATTAGILLVAPASPKILATGNGGVKTDKAAMLAAARLERAPAHNGDEADAWWIAELARVLVDPAARDAASGLGRYPPHRIRALDRYQPPFDNEHPDPWVRHPKD